jgi:hypothetical protein
LHFRFSLDRFGHLLVPSEIFTRRGKKDFEILESYLGVIPAAAFPQRQAKAGTS